MINEISLRNCFNLIKEISLFLIRFSSCLLNLVIEMYDSYHNSIRT